MIKVSVYLFQKNSKKFGVFCALEALNGAWECDFMSLPAFLLVLTLRILLKNWSFLSCGSGATLGISRAIQTRRAEDGVREELELQEFERERERPLFWDQLSFYEELVTTDEYFMIGRIMLLSSSLSTSRTSLCTLHATQTKSATVLNTEISFSHTYAKGAKMTKCHDGF